MQRSADNRATAATKRDRLAAPVFADVRRFAEPSPSRMVWAHSPTGQHPAFV